MLFYITCGLALANAIPFASNVVSRSNFRFFRSFPLVKAERFRWGRVCIHDYTVPYSNPRDQSQPTRLISPETLLRRRHGNSFEMATLLCSLLIGNNYGAFVVSGYATREVVNNDQKRVECPYIPHCSSQLQDSDAINSEKHMNKYTLRRPIDLQSKFVQEVETKRLAKIEAEKQLELEMEMQKRIALERLDEDPEHGKRLHAWVVILSNVDWAAKKSVDESVASDEVKPFFIEPTTGVHFSENDLSYWGIESVWNNQNYYVNCQEPLENGIAKMEWDLLDSANWQSLLDTRAMEQWLKTGETQTSMATAGVIHSGTQLDMPNSWCERLFLNNIEFDERFPDGEKTIYFQRVIYERFSPFLKKNGLVKRLRQFDDLEYTDELKCWEWYQQRKDRLTHIEYDLKANAIVEHYATGRNDYLKLYTRSTEPMQPEIFEYHTNSRPDGLMKLEMHPRYLREHFEDRKNEHLRYRDFALNEFDGNLDKIVEHFRRNRTKESHEDIYIRTFDMRTKKITLQFHYGPNEITPTIREYVCPPKPEYGCEIKFNEDENVVDITNRHERNVSKLMRYHVLLDQLQAQEECQTAYKKRSEDIAQTLSDRKSDMENPILNFSIFDPLRNSGARSMRMAKEEHYEKQRCAILGSSPDFIAPYLVRFVNGKPNATESIDIYEKCLQDIQNDFTDLLNNLQQLYDQTCAEQESLKKFLNQFGEKLEEFDHQRYVKEGMKMDLTKRTIQQRIIDTEDEFNEKYERVKAQMQSDSRLNLSTLKR